MVAPLIVWGYTFLRWPAGSHPADRVHLVLVSVCSCREQELSGAQGDSAKYRSRAQALETQLAVASQRVNVVEGELEQANAEIVAARQFRRQMQVSGLGLY